MCPLASEEAMSSASPATLIDRKQTAGPSNVVETAMSSASPATGVDQQQTAGLFNSVEKAMSTASPAALIEQQQTAGPSSAVKHQLCKQIAELEDDIRQLKLNQDPKREAVKYTLLQDELAQLREKNLNLRVELQVAQEGHRALEEKHEKYRALEGQHERCKKLMQKAIENLSLGLDVSNGESANIGLATEGAAPGVSLPPRQSVSSLSVEKASDTPSAFRNGDETHPSGFLASSINGGSPVQANIFGQPPVRSSAAQSLFVPPRAFQTNQEQAPKSLYLGSTPPSFRPDATTRSSKTGKVSCFLYPPQVNKPAPSMFGDPQETIQHGSDGEKLIFVSTPGFCNREEQSFEEARLRCYELYYSSTWPEEVGNSRASAPYTLSGGFPLSPGQNFF